MEFAQGTIFRSKLLNNNLCLIGFGILAFITLMGVLAPVIAKNPYKTNIAERLEPPNLKHPFGTDQLGRDVYSRVVWGVRTTLLVALTISLMSMSIGCFLGAIAGYFGGIVDDIIGRVIDVFLAIPELVFNIALVGVFCLAYGESIWNVILAVVITNWVSYARIMRGIVISLKEREFVLCEKALGAGDLYILIRHVMPNAIGPMIVLATLNMGNVIMTIASLGFLGLGIQPPTPEWGQMINAGKNYITTAPWLTFFPGLFIAVSILGFNLLGEGLQEVMDRERIVET